MKDKINSRKKGAKAERNVALLLKKWTGYEFARTPSSGGLWWKNTNTIGDVVCTDERHFFPFAIEVKVRKHINFEHLFYLEKAEILKFWKQAVDDAKRGKKLPLLFMRYNGMPSGFWILALQTKDFKELKSQLKTQHPYAIYRGIKNLVLMSSKCFTEAQYNCINKTAIEIIDKRWPRKD